MLSCRCLEKQHSWRNLGFVITHFGFICITVSWGIFQEEHIHVLTIIILFVSPWGICKCRSHWRCTQPLHHFSCALNLLIEGLVALSWSRYGVARREGGQRKPVLAHVSVKCWAHTDGVIETRQMFIQGHCWCAHPQQDRSSTCLGERMKWEQRLGLCCLSAGESKQGKGQLWCRVRRGFC